MSTWAPTAATAPPRASRVPPSSSGVPIASAYSSAPVDDIPGLGPRPLPADVATAAARFTVAWSSHDVRPGRDVSYADAADRAAEFATPALGAVLRSADARPPRVWRQWVVARAVVSVDIVRVEVPAGAPEPTSQFALARVHFQVITTPSRGVRTVADGQVALELRRGPTGGWLVSAVPNA
jgi:hypothetical protein